MTWLVLADKESMHDYGMGCLIQCPLAPNKCDGANLQQKGILSSRE